MVVAGTHEGGMMTRRPPVVVTATANICWLEPEVDFPRTPEERATSAKACEDAGASVIHMHAEDSWTASLEAVRSASGAIVQCGMSSLTIPERMEVFEHHAEMISVIASHHDEAFVGVETNVLHTREEMRQYAELCREYRVKPEWEIWHTGSIWNLRWMIDQGLLDPPYVTTLFFGWPGGTWSPPTVEEYLYRRKMMPEECAVTVSIMGPEGYPILAAAIGQGDHVRVGTEDYPRLHDGSVAPTEKLVAQVVDLVRAMGRHVARPEEARELLGIYS
jgi:3-keto-5-aminohexanoate cleavage enzyme